MVLKRLDCPEHFVGLIPALRDGMVGQILGQNYITEFPITNGLTQGCVLSPTLFALYLVAVLYQTSTHNTGVKIWYEIDGGLFSQADLTQKD